VHVHVAEEAHAHEAGEHEAGAHEHGEHAHTPFNVGIDFVLGFGAHPLLAPAMEGAAEDAESEEVPEGWRHVRDVKTMSESIVIDGSYEVAEHVGVGVRIPLTFGSVPASAGDTTSTFALGNIELEGETELELSETTALVLSLGVAVPTAQGSEEPELEDGELSSDYQHFIVNHLAAASRGYEDNALFEPERLGIIPKVAFQLRENSLLFQPFIKLENLIATNSELERGYIAELIYGMFFGYAINPHFDVGARVWGSAAFLDNVEQVAIVEPQVRVHFAPVDVLVGGIIPFAGELTKPQFGGVRIAAHARF
jgi:hypothetical protein